MEIAFPDDASDDDLPSGYEQQFQQMMGMMKNLMQDRVRGETCPHRSGAVSSFPSAPQSGGRPRAGPERMPFADAVARTEEAMLARKAADPALKRQAIRVRGRAVGAPLAPPRLTSQRPRSAER